jgi:catecholate siderophore receptor
MTKGVKSFARSAAQLAVLGASSLALMGPAWAQERHEGHGHGQGGHERSERDADHRDDNDNRDDPITVTGVRGHLESPRYTAPILDTPQTITVVTSETIEEQNLLNLRDILSTLPGITFGAGEGGGGYGDSINLRGFSANNDITVDGVRDSAQYTRSDPFNLEQIELTTGANSVYAGAGSVGGSINLVSKRPHGNNDTALSIAGGTDAYARVTADTDQMLTEGIAARLNLMIHQNDVPGRDVETNERFGIAPSITFGVGGPTQFTLSYFYQTDDNTPQYGVPFAINIVNNGPLPGVDPSDYYGIANFDRQQSQVDQLSGIFEHTFSDNLSLRNLTRYQVVSQDLQSSAPQGAFCLANNTNPFTSSTGASQACTTPAGTYAPSGPRGNVRNSENVLYYNQTDLTMEFNTGGIEHTMVAGLALTREEYDLVNGNALRNPNGATPNPPLTTPLPLVNPNTNYFGPVNFIPGGGALANGPGGTCVTATLVNCVAPAGGSEGERENIALYVFDTAELSPNWEINGGLRVEQNQGQNRTAYYTAYGYLPSGNTNVVGAASPGASAGVFNGWSAWAENEDTLVSYRVGLVYKPVENASFYIAYGNSETPSQASVNGGCTIDAGTTGAASCNVDPEEAVNYEIGAKYDALGGNLQLTAAIFRNERSNYRVNSNEPGVPAQQLDGESRVDGIALGATGLLTDNWSVFANYTYLDSEIIQGVSDFCIANPGAAGCALGGNNAFAGDPLPTTPEHSFSLWTTYEVSHGFMLGYGVTYQGEYTFGRVNATRPLFYTDDYWVHRAMVSYQIGRNAVVQLNVNNLTDEEYYERVRNNATGGWATPGAARNAVLSLNLQF